MRARLSSSWSKLGIALALAAGMTSAVACGGDDDGDGSQAGRGGLPGTAGAATGGSSGAPPAEPVGCGDALCQPLSLPGYPPVQACCADAETARCGLDTSLLAAFGAESERACEPKDQPGELDSACPDSTAFNTGQFEIPPFSGCCRADTGTCGYFVDRVILFSIGLGCIDSAPFLDEGTEPVPCGS